MDPTIQKALHDKLYDRRKGGALELEKLIRECLATENHDKIHKVVDQLCHDYAYAIHQPYARNGGLIGLAAVSIALGSASSFGLLKEVARYLEEIVPPVLSCFTDQDARVRYYACESMYNIAKTSKGEILPYFNEVFDALAKLTADSELSVKNGAELLDRLVKDIISDSATSYVSVVGTYGGSVADDEAIDTNINSTPSLNAAFSLARFIPLLQERILVMSPFTRMFLVSWITLLNSIPDLELVSYLPSFLGGLFRFLSDGNQDVVTATQHILERFLDEIKLVARVNKDLSKHRARRASAKNSTAASIKADLEKGKDIAHDEETRDATVEDSDRTDSDADGPTDTPRDDWTPGQDVSVDHSKILEILIAFLGDAKGTRMVLPRYHNDSLLIASTEEHIQLTALRWIDCFFAICPNDILHFVPRLLNQVLPALSSDVPHVRQAGNRVNTSLQGYIARLPDEDDDTTESKERTKLLSNQTLATEVKQEASSEVGEGDRNDQRPNEDYDTKASPDASKQDIVPSEAPKALDYEACVTSLTLQFLNESEATKISALSWLIMLQNKSPQKVLAAHDGTFPALLRTLSDTSETVVARDLQLLCQISRNSNDSYFKFFMVNLLKLFSGDRRLLETRGNLIIRQLCTNLSPERIYRTMADCLEKNEDYEFASIMVQYLNNNLITAPELADLRKKLRNWETRVGISAIYTGVDLPPEKDGQSLFVALFRAWCHNAVSTLSLCLLGQTYEQAYNLMQMFADIEITVNMLIQLDKLVQLLESPVFTYLRLQLLEPERHPYLYKCLYGILMLLPQSAAFAALKNRLNSVSAIGYLHAPSSVRGSQTPTSGAAPFERAGRLKSREDGAVKWSELLERFRSSQDRAKRASRSGTPEDGVHGSGAFGTLDGAAQRSGTGDRRLLPPPDGALRRLQTSPGPGADGSRSSNGSLQGVGSQQGGKEQGHKSRFSSSNFGRFASGVKGRTKK
ncbi:MAG: hypothetical protein M1828_004418 [Chrysothrix sp. TS-e1954]|nr:MAG: hypothetical protein M1828_004418 [Chrysothrix sp. TS-e1954]